jgi:hypothetical protein
MPTRFEAPGRDRCRLHAVCHPHASVQVVWEPEGPGTLRIECACCSRLVLQVGPLPPSTIGELVRAEP